VPSASTPAERLFEEIRRPVYAPLDDKATVVQAPLEEFDADSPRVRRPCDWD